MAITRWDPFGDMRMLTRQMERMFEPLLKTEPYTPENTMRMEAWPPVDIYEDKDEIVFHVEMPGMERKNVELLMEDTTLTIRGERTLEMADKRENYRCIERPYGTFTRTFTVPTTVDREKIRADMRNGVLYVHLPKREGSKPKSIAINA